jgi:hypothetical protein
MASSPDGIVWTKHGRDLISSRLGEDECQASPEVFFLHGKYHMLFSFRHALDFKNRERGYRIGYASSEDMVNWNRDDTRAGIDVSKEGWDSEMVSYPHLLELDGKAYLFYQGNQIGRFGFGVAKLESYQP